MSEAPSSSQRAQGNKRLIVISLAQRLKSQLHLYLLQRRQIQENMKERAAALHLKIFLHLLILLLIYNTILLTFFSNRNKMQIRHLKCFFDIDLILTLLENNGSVVFEATIHSDFLVP